MASSSSPRTWKYNVFTSFHGPDVRKTFLSHLRKQFNYNGITMFDDEKIKRSAVIAPALIQAIKESRISIVVLSKQYASSSWCLDELLEIMKCKEDLGQKVMTVFYGVEPSDVRNQNGEFGDAFKTTCAKKTEEEHREKWRKVLTKVGNIAGEDFKNWKNEAEMIEKIARDISDILLDTAPKDFDDMVGFEAHMREMESRLDFDNNDEVKIVAISGPAGIGKTTIARAIYSRHSNNFHNDCFLDLRKTGCNEYASREQLLSELLNLNGIQKCHSGLIPEMLHDQRVFIILDDVHHLNQLDDLADIRWYGPGSRIIVTTENKEILQQHGINDIYHVSFPSGDEALKIFCLSAFRQPSPPAEFKILVNEVVGICGNLPLGLKVLGSSLKGKTVDDWKLELPRMKDSLDKGIEGVLQFGYDSLHVNDQVIFLCIAVFFNGKRYDDVLSMVDVPDWQAELGLKKLSNRCLIQHIGGKVEMHNLLRLMAREVLINQDSKQKILVDPRKISNVLKNATGNDSVVGISFDIAKVKKLIISTKAFDEMFNLHFLKVHDEFITNDLQEMIGGQYFMVSYKSNREVHIPEEMELPDHLRFVHWDEYPRKNLPLGFCTENLVNLKLRFSRLEKLWKGNQPLSNLKEIDVSCSPRLKKLPDLSTATNLEILNVCCCSALVEIPSSIANRHKLRQLTMRGCGSLEIIPCLANLTNLEDYISFKGCSKLRTFPDFPINQTCLYLNNTGVKELPASFRHCSGLWALEMNGSRNLRTFSTHLPTSIRRLELRNSSIESITDYIKCLPNLRYLDLSECKRLLLLPQLQSSLHFLKAENCISLKRVSVPLKTPNANLHLINCFKLDSQARREIIQQSYFTNREWAGTGKSGWGILPGREVPDEFIHRSTRNFLTIPPSAFNRVKGCIIISPKLLQDIFRLGRGNKYERIYLDCKINGNLVRSIEIYDKDTIQAEHLIIFCSDFLSFDPSTVSTNLVLDCRFYLDFHRMECRNYPLDVIEWGIQILMDEKDLSTTWDSGKDYYTREQRRTSELQISEDMEFPVRLRFVQWEGYPVKSLPHGFCTEKLIKFELRYSLLEKLWEGTQPLASLKEIDVSFSTHLKKLPDLSTATNLEILNVRCCSALVGIPSLVGNFHKLRQLTTQGCGSLEIIPSLANLTNLEDYISFNGCSKLRTFPDFPTNQTCLYLNDTRVKELPASLSQYFRLYTLKMEGSRNLRTFSTHLPTRIHRLELRNSGIESITDCIKCLPYLEYLNLSECKRLVLLPELPSSLHFLRAENCESLEKVSVPLNTPIANLHFTNCFKLDSQARRGIIQESYFTNREWAGTGKSGWGILPGREVPEEFIHRSTRNFLTIPPSAFNRVKGCILISPKLLQDIFRLGRGCYYDSIYFDCKINGNLVRSIEIYDKDTIQAEHLIIFCSDFLSFDPSTVSTNLVLDCRFYLDFERRINYPLDVIEWGIQTLTDEKDLSTTWYSSQVSGLKKITKVITSLKKVIQRLFSKTEEN